MTPKKAFRRWPELRAPQFHAEMAKDPRFEAWLDGGADAVAAAGTSPERLRAEHDALGLAATRAGQARIAEWLRGL